MVVDMTVTCVRPDGEFLSSGSFELDLAYCLLQKALQTVCMVQEVLS